MTQVSDVAHRPLVFSAESAEKYYTHQSDVVIILI
jgi:hypothetical protein